MGPPQVHQQLPSEPLLPGQLELLRGAGGGGEQREPGGAQHHLTGALHRVHPLHLPQHGRGGAQHPARHPRHQAPARQALAIEDVII